MAKYVEKSRYVEAVQFNKFGDHPDVIASEALETGYSLYLTKRNFDSLTFEAYTTKELAQIRLGDYIITDPDGVMRIWPKDKFESIYDLVPPPAPEPKQVVALKASAKNLAKTVKKKTK